MNIHVAKCNLGRGVFASRHFVAGERILAFGGPIINCEQAMALGHRHVNVLQIDDDQYVDITSPAVYLNHSCDPNAGVTQNTILVAVRDISSGDEICFDYSTTMGDGTWTMRCLCTAAHCRKFITDFQHLPPALKHRYMSMGIVQSFLTGHSRVGLVRNPGDDCGVSLGRDRGTEEG